MNYTWLFLKETNPANPKTYIPPNSCGTEFLGGTQLVCPLIAVFSIGIFPTPCGGNPCFKAIKSAMIQPGNWQGIGVTPMSFGRQTVKVSHPPCHLRHLEVRLLDFFWGEGKCLDIVTGECLKLGGSRNF